MYGCGKFEDSVFLGYIDRSLDEERMERVDEHMQSCEACLEEAAELTRVNAAMDADVPGALPEILYLRVFAEGGKFLGFSWNGPSARLVPASAVRSGEAERETLRAESGSLAVMLRPVDGFYELELDGAGDGAVRLSEPGALLPLWQGRAEGGKLLLRGVSPGNYEISVDGKAIHLSMG
jgi:anti-sigma factor RsiW